MTYSAGQQALQTALATEMIAADQAATAYAVHVNKDNSDPLGHEQRRRDWLRHLGNQQAIASSIAAGNYELPTQPKVADSEEPLPITLIPPSEDVPE